MNLVINKSMTDSPSPKYYNETVKQAVYRYRTKNLKDYQERQRVYQKTYYAKNKESCSAYQKTYYEKNKERIKQQVLDYQNRKKQQLPET
jgi:hypothetical protein